MILIQFLLVLSLLLLIKLFKNNKCYEILTVNKNEIKR